jgi:hypothetical protein
LNPTVDSGKLIPNKSHPSRAAQPRTDQQQGERPCSSPTFAVYSRSSSSPQR